MDNAEVLDVAGKRVCQKISGVPSGIFSWPSTGGSPTGGFVSGEPVICGGIDGQRRSKAECYALRNNKFQKLPYSMTARRGHAASAVILDGSALLVTG